MNLPKHKNWVKQLGSLKSSSYKLTKLNDENRYLVANKRDTEFEILVLEFDEFTNVSVELDNAIIDFDQEFDINFNEQCDEFAEIWSLQ